MKHNDSNEFFTFEELPPMPYQPQVVVKFKDEVQLPDTGNIEEFLDRDEFWSKLKEQFPNIQISRLFKSVEPSQIRELVESAKANDPDYVPPNFSNYFIIDKVKDRNTAALAHALSDWVLVAEAYVVPKPAPPPLVNQILNFQNFLRPAKEGIHAEYAWSVAGGNGDNIRFIDMEKGWYLGHPALPAGINPIALPQTGNGGGDNREFQGHGTAVLGIVLGQDAGTNCQCPGGIPCKCTGIARNAISNWVSEFRSVHDVNPNKADAILAAIAFLNSFGDAEGSVLLLESQSNLDNGNPAAPDFIPSQGYAPVEVYTAEFDAIKLATASGIVVIEPAGNALGTTPGSYRNGIDLDTLIKRSVVPGTGQIIQKRILYRPDLSDPPNPDYQDSGAIVVGAGTWAIEHERKPNPPLATSVVTGVAGPIPAAAGPPTNYGRRVDCYAWGEYVRTTGSGGISISNGYTALFSGTSSAAAIIAGVALIVQGIARANHLGAHAKGTYTPAELRSILSNPLYGTASNNRVNDRIGVMPDLKKILDIRMGLPPH
jgi:serine protease